VNTCYLNDELLLLVNTGPVTDAAALQDASRNAEIYHQHGQTWSGNMTPIFNDNP